MHICPICSNPSTVVKYKLTFTVYQCNNCGFQFCPEAKFDTSFSSNLIEGTRERALKVIRKQSFQRIIASIIKHGKNNPAGLEVGCGYGWFLESCKENFINCEGIEPETRFNEKYRSQGLKVKNGFYPEELPAGSKYDFIAFNDVIEHIPDVAAIMKANYSFLNQNGLLILNLPIQDGLVYFFAKIAYHFGMKSILNRMWQFNFHSPHISYFKKGNLLKFAVDSNFQLIESFKLKTINLSEISDRIRQDSEYGFFRFIISFAGALFLYPFFQFFPDTYCFVFKK
jgi:2-polyprenyl-3-methyl-5-hydroxy-6-metoxy-1,4-benzoquinol methylase